MSLLHLGASLFDLIGQTLTVCDLLYLAPPSASFYVVIDQKLTLCDSQAAQLVNSPKRRVQQLATVRCFAERPPVLTSTACLPCLFCFVHDCNLGLAFDPGPRVSLTGAAIIWQIQQYFILESVAPDAGKIPV
jgi:hypothetical protein